MFRGRGLTFFLMTGMVRVQLPPQSGQSALKGRMPSTYSEWPHEDVSGVGRWSGVCGGSKAGGGRDVGWTRHIRRSRKRARRRKRSMRTGNRRSTRSKRSTRSTGRRTPGAKDGKDTMDRQNRQLTNKVGRTAAQPPDSREAACEVRVAKSEKGGRLPTFMSSAILEPAPRSDSSVRLY